MSRYLTKSKFKTGLECVTKLYYTGKKNEYADQKIDDKFLKALAEGGHQTGALSLFEFCDDPIGEDIIVESLDYDESLRITNEKLSREGRVVIAEGAFKFNNLFIRADIIVKSAKEKVIDLYEVKAKSFNSAIENEDTFISYLGKKNECVNSKWLPYLYDIAFQKYVITKAMPEFKVNSHLLLVDKSKKATVNGLNQIFQISRNGDRISVELNGIQKSQLGDSILHSVNTDVTVEKIWNKYKVPTTLNQDFTFESFVQFCEDLYVRDERKFSPLTMGCKDCTFWTRSGKDEGLKDGRLECWKHITAYSDVLLTNPWTIDVWQGRMDNALNQGIYLMGKLDKSNIGGVEPKGDEKARGMEQYDRRWKQIEKVKNNDDTYFFDKVNFDKVVEKWKWPLNHIDFETSTSALPFYKDKTPYSGIAFQWSHHLMHEDGKIEQFGQYINFEKGMFPNLEFIRTLKKSLSANNGTIFRYHNHENTYLRMIYDQISSGELEVEDPEKSELLNFIELITRHKPNGKDYVQGERNMVDLYDIVQRYYYPPFSKGKVGLKFILPSIINDVPFLKSKYGRKGLYGKGLEVNSLNFEDHQWIDSDFNNDPYKTLPIIFEGYDRDILDEYFSELDGIADGGAALSAYSYLQYTRIPDDLRLKLKEGLLRYCELDTMAMCFLVEGMMLLNNQE
jgi:hypothetical protein